MFRGRLWPFLLMMAACVSGPVVQAQVVDKAVMNSTVLITWEEDPANVHGRQQPAMISGGTGFLLFDGLGITKGRVYLVTNKHNLPPEGKQKGIKVRVVVRDNDGESRVEDVSVPVVGPDGKYLPSVHLHPDPDTDVAAINIAATAFGSKFQLLIDAIQTGKRLDTSMLLSKEQTEEEKIGIGSQVYVLGFPAALYDPRNVTPVLRVGVISTDPQNGYTFNESLRKMTGLPAHIDGFLIDSNIYPGSSGSLVIAVPENHPQESSKKSKKTKGKEEKETNWQPRILGIVAGSIPIFDSSLRSYERIGLGIVYSSDAIREVLR